MAQSNVTPNAECDTVLSRVRSNSVESAHQPRSIAQHFDSATEPSLVRGGSPAANVEENPVLHEGFRQKLLDITQKGKKAVHMVIEDSLDLIFDGKEKEEELARATTKELTWIYNDLDSAHFDLSKPRLSILS